VRIACESDASDCDEIIKLKLKILANVDRRFPMTDAVKIASLLDPSSKNKKYVEMSFSEKQDLVLSAARDDGNSKSSYSASNVSESSDVCRW